MLHAYKLFGRNIIVDGSSGCIHFVDDAAWDAICVYGEKGADKAKDYTRNKYRDLNEGEIEELFSDIEGLKAKGKLFSEDTFSGIPRAAHKRQIKALCLNMAHSCNMKCAYCFAMKEESAGGAALMPAETGRQAIDFLLENSGESRNLDVDFFGGEPLLNWGAVTETVKYAREKERERGKKFRFTLTTNALKLNDEVTAFANREISNVVLSLDGTSQTNDAMRKLPDGRGSYAQAMPNIKRFVEARGHKGYYIRGTYTRRNVKFVDDLLHLYDLGFSELSMEPVVAAKTSDLRLEESDLPALFSQYERLALEMRKREEEGRGFTFYHYMLDLKNGPCIHKRIAGCGAGTEYMAVTPEGDLYPCHRFIGDRNFLLGSVKSGFNASAGDLRDEFSGCNIYTRQECKKCWARLYCSSGCAASAYSETGSIAGVYSFGCELFKKRLECAIYLKLPGVGRHGV